MKLLLKVSFRYGIVAGFLSIVLLLTLFYLDRHPFMIAPFLDFRILLFGILIFFSLKEFRDYHQDGILYFWQGMIGSAVIVFTALILSSIGLQIFGMAQPDFVTSYVTQATTYLKTIPQETIEQIGKENYERNLKDLSSTNMSMLTITYFIHGIVIGFFVSIILSVILRKQPKN
ncbi:MAG TPA: DUF4199 domain-containing protein [Ohtaekwangia sp.]